MIFSHLSSDKSQAIATYQFFFATMATAFLSFGSGELKGLSSYRLVFLQRNSQPKLNKGNLRNRLQRKIE